MFQQPLFVTTTSDWKLPNLNELPSWEKVKRIGLDTETRDPRLKTRGKLPGLGPGGGRRAGSYLAGVSFALEDGPAFYLPIRHMLGKNLPIDNTLKYLRDQAKHFDGLIVGANLSYDLDFLESDGVVFPKTKFFRDIQVADVLINELHTSYSLDSIAERRGVPGKDETKLRQAAADYKIDPKADMWRLPPEYVGDYAEQDAKLPLVLLRRQERDIDEQDLWRVFDLESRLLPVLVKLRRRGVRVDLDKLGQIEEWSLNGELQLLKEVDRLTGVKIPLGEVWKPEVLEPALKYIGVSVGRTSQGKPNIDKDLFDRIDHPVGRLIARARKINKLRTTFAQSVRNHLIGDRIHCIFNQMKRERDDGDGTAGAAYGRLSSEHPNLQQQPSRDDFAPLWRSIYLPEEGKKWAANDYSQQEPRMAVHYASISKEYIGRYAWLAAIEARDKYRNDPTTDNHQMMADMAGISRKNAKGIYLGLSYGMGGAKLCRQLGLPTMMGVYGPRGVIYPLDSMEGQRLVEGGARVFETAGPEGQELLKTFDHKVPFIKRLAKACERRAKEVGYIMTLSGRRCHFPKDLNGNYDWTHKALNRLIQGGSADQTKTAMIECDAEGFDMIIQVHDEVAFSVGDSQEAEKAADIMRTCVPLELPSKVDVEIGENWGDSMGSATFPEVMP